MSTNVPLCMLVKMGFLMHAMKFLFLFLIIFFFFEPQLMCSSYLLSSSNVVFCPPDQSLALLQFKNTFSANHSMSSYCDDVSYLKTDYWNESVDCCLWDGVTCDDDTGNVIGLDLSCSWLQGVIHSNSSLFNLFHLRRLNLAYNDFMQSQISPNFGRFSSLTHLILSSSMLSGKVPFDVSHLSRLVSLDLAGNEGLEFDESVFKGLVKNLTQLTQLCLTSVNMSSVPPNLLMNISSSLTTLELGFNGMLGNFPADYVFHLPNLQYLKLYANHLTGSLPETNWSTSLKTLGLRGCHFTGSLPMSIGNLTQITGISISSNDLSGEIPASISNLVQLESLGLEDNKFQGQIPDAFDYLSKLTRIYLGRNRLTGRLPSSIFNLTQLLYIDFSSNQLEGPLPEHATQLSKLSRLFLSDNMLKGIIPPWLLSLPFLEYLFLENNLLTGNISEIKTSSLLYIDLSNNNLSGPIPRSIFKLENMTTLVLSSNNLSGVVEMDTPSKLKNLIMLDLHRNLLEGRLPTPPKTLVFFFASKNNFTGEVSSSICHLEQLMVLDLSHNNLAGKVPRCLGNFSNNLSELNIRMNSFQGTIPEELGTNLRSLKLNGNQFGGSLPRSLLNCSKLEVLEVGNNKLHDIFPNWLETLPELQVLVLQSNSFHGLVRSGSKANNLFPKLKIFDISRNNFSGPLPTGYFKNFKAMMDFKESKSDKQYIGGSFYNDSLELTIKGQEMQLVKVLTILTTIDLSENRFEGEIPKVIGELKLLKSLNLSHNNFTGQIPASIGLLTNLEGLDLSSNNLTGQIPEEMANLTFLSFLNLSRNNLIGRIPQGHQLDTFGNDSYKGNLRLCGVPLTKKCSDEEGSQPPPSTSFQQDDEMEHENLLNWKAISLGYGCGIVYGVVMGYFLLHRGRYRARLLCLYC